MSQTVTTEVAPPVEKEPAAPVPNPKRQAPTREERLRLIGGLQAKAMERADPLAANLEVLNGDLMLFAYRLREAMEEQGASGWASPERFPEFAVRADLFLKFTRQIDRLAQIARQGQDGARQGPQGG